MEICSRRARPGELDHELLWLSVSLGGLVAAGVWLSAGLPWPHCIFLAITGRPCVSCGATRAAIQLLHGHFLEAFRWNPLAFIAFSAVFLFDIYAAIVLVTRAPRLRISGATSAQKRSIRFLILIMLALNWIYLLTRSVSYS